MTKLNTILILSLYILTTACQKRKYPEENVQLGKKDIYFDGYIGNDPITLKIGTDGYYCYSSYQQPEDSVYVFQGEMKKFNCNPCPLAFRVELSDYRLRLPGSSVPIDSALRTGSRIFIPGVSRPNTIRFAPLSNKQVASVRWELSNGYSSQGSILSYEFTQPGPQTVSLTVRTTGNCESMVVNKVFAGGTGGLFACGITAEQIQNNNSGFTTNLVGGKPPFSYTWYFGDGGTSNQPAPTHNYAWAGGYPVKLRVEDAEHHVCESNSIHVAGNDPSSCSANMSLSLTGRRNMSLSGVKIQWTDQANIILRSDSIVQPAGSYFEVLNSQAYEPNEKGEAGQLLTLRFNVLLANGTRNVWMKSENTTIAVTYK